MTDDNVHHIPIEKRDATVIYLFRVSLYQPGSEHEGWVGTHPLLEKYEREAYGSSKYEAWCSAQVQLDFLLKENPRLLQEYNHQSTVIVTDKPEATVIGRPTSMVDGLCVYLKEEHEKLFLTYIIEKYKSDRPKVNPEVQKTLSLLHAINDAFRLPDRFERPELERVNPLLIEELTRYMIMELEGHQNHDLKRVFNTLLLSFTCIVATAVADHVAYTDESGITKLGGFEVPQWFVQAVRRDWRQERRFQNSYFEYKFEDHSR